MIRVLLPWLALMTLLAFEIGAALLHMGTAAAVAAPVMIAIVAGMFMQIGRETPLSRVFAVAGLFWLAILIGLGSVDFIARKDVPTPQTTSSSQFR
jgi:cytochrome c oxidase subunit 4